MLRGLDIRNVAVIEKLSIEFYDGMTVLTGETGAGKSIIIDSINMILGSRANKSLVRHGAQKASVSACFAVNKEILEELEKLGIEPEDGEIIISRELTSDGKSTARINGMMVSLNTLREAAAGLINIHGQQDNQAILDSSKHIGFLDIYGDTLKLVEQYEAKRSDMKRIKRQLDDMEVDEREKLRRVDMLKYQLDEIEKADLKVGEKEKLLDERVLVVNRAKIAEGVACAYKALYESEGMSTYDGISIAADSLEGISDYDKNIGGLYSRLVDVKYAVEDIVHELRGMDLEYDENYLNDIEERLDTITGLEKKYGGTVEAVLDFYDNAAHELDNIQNSDEVIKKLKIQLSEEEKRLKYLGEELYKERKKAGERLGKAVEKELCELDMEKSKFEVSVEHKNEFLKNGMDIVEFMITTNPGEPLKPLTKVASGGELSRTMLALKTVLAECGGADTLIFDEIDTGVSGRAAQKIAAKLWGLGKQVICISHQPQPAAYADNHYYIEKKVTEDCAKTTVRLLNDEERILEVARIIDGSDITEAAKAHASEMINSAKEKKCR